VIIELGRIVREVEVREVADGKKVMNNALAIQRGKNMTTFVEFEAWDQMAERIEKYFKKGYEILLQGQLINKKKKRGEVEYTGVGILVDKIYFTNGNPRNGALEKEPTVE